MTITADVNALLHENPDPVRLRRLCLMPIVWHDGPDSFP